MTAESEPPAPTETDCSVGSKAPLSQVTSSMKTRLVNGLIFLVVSSLYAVGGLTILDDQFIDLRFRLLQHDATDDIVLVRMDSPSVEGLGVWPWPRRLHAEAITRLLAAGAERVVVDIDLSSKSNAEDDALLAEAVAAADGRVVLPVFTYFDRPQDPASVVHIQPIPELRRNATLASANVNADSHGLIRRGATNQAWKNGPIVTLSALLANATEQSPGTFYIDYGLRPQSVPQLSFIDVLNGDFDPALIAGRRIVIGATAAELSDIAVVPVWGAMSGPMVQVLAAQSLIQGSALVDASPFVILLAIGVLILWISPYQRGHSWQTNLIGLVALCSLAAAAAWMAHAQFSVLLDVSAIGLAGGLCFAANLAMQVDEQKVRVLTQAFALRRKDRFLRNIVEHVFDGLMVIDANGIVLSFNPAAGRLFGYRPEEIIGQPLGTLVEGTQWTTSPEKGIEPAEFAATGQPQEVIGRRSDGSTFPIELAVTEMRAEDRATYIVWARDISDRQKAERMATEARTLLEAIESMSEGFALFDASDRLVLCNSKLCEIYAPVAHVLERGRSYKEIVRSLAELHPSPVTADATQQWIDQRLAWHADPGAPIEEQMIDRRWYRIQEYRTAMQGTVAVVDDITVSKQRERQLEQSKEAADEASRYKTQFLANMSHELRTPLNAVIGFSEVIVEETLGAIGNAKYKEYAGDIRSSATHLLDIINDILDISRIESGKTEVHDDDVDLNRVIQTVLNLFKDRAADSQITLIHADPAPLPILRADPRLVRQMISNLVANAVRFTPEAGQVRVSAQLSADGCLVVRVEDTGIGIAESDLGRIMRPFEQASVGTARRFDGTGLGLPLVNSFARLHGGKLKLNSALGQGTMASITFPADRTKPNLRVASG